MKIRPSLSGAILVGIEERCDNSFYSVLKLCQFVAQSWEVNIPVEYFAVEGMESSEKVRRHCVYIVQTQVRLPICRWKEKKGQNRVETALKTN